MRCKKHFNDLSSSVGVCATCLRERLFALVAAQAVEDRRKYDSQQPPPLVFPRSVSPYITRRKSDNTDWQTHHHHHHSISDQRFYSTPQVGPTGFTIGTASSYKKKHSKFSLLSNLFRSRSRKVDLEEDHRVSVSNSRESCTTSPSWFSSMLSGHRKKQSRLFSMEDSNTGGASRNVAGVYGNRDRGMSPARYSEDGAEEECTGYSSESSQGWRETPTRATRATRGGGRPMNHGRNVSGLAFCLSPMVRASPNRHWNQKGMPPDMSVNGDTRVQVKPHLSNAASYCANRSRKLADFGRFNPNR
ncbi:hypothetical protein LguiB_023454 [Lonicera macranthoides]